MGIVREKVYLNGVQVSTCLVDACEDSNCSDEAFSTFRKSQTGTESRDEVLCKIKGNSYINV
jgi:hypothetical protein